MAGPIKISVLADTRVATRAVNGFADSAEQAAQRVVTSLGDSKLQGSWGKLQEGFDVADTRAMGFRDTITGVQDSMTALQALTTSTADAQNAYNEAVKKYGKDSQEAKAAQEALEQTQKSLGDKILLLGTGVGDLASGFANFLVPMMAVVAGFGAQAAAAQMSTTAFLAQKVSMTASAVATGAMTAAQWLLNAALTANPIGIIIVAIVALVAAIVLAYKNSETFRAIVQAVWAAIKNAVSTVINWITTNVPKIWDKVRSVWENIRSSASTAWNAVSTTVRTTVDKVVTFVKEIPEKIKAFFSNAGSILKQAGIDIVTGLWNGLKEKWEAVKKWFSDVTSQIPDLKGPASRDAQLLRKNGQLVMQGFQDGLESRFASVRASLSGFTTSIGGSIEPGGLALAGGGSSGDVRVSNTVMLDGQPFRAMTTTAVQESERRSAWATYAGRRI